MPHPTPDSAGNHGGILFPLDMFRPSMLASALAEALVARARNVLDARLVLTRHPEVSLVLARIEGSVVGDDPAAFWRENAELAMFASQVLPRQCFMYFMAEGPEKRQGFVVAQQGQVLAGDDAGPDTLPAGTPDDQWPVNRLCAQIQIHPFELAEGFAGGPTVSLSLVEPSAAEDQAALMTLAGQPPDGADADDPDDTGALAGEADDPRMAAAGRGATSGPGATTGAARPRPEDDVRRRASELEAEQRAREALAEQVAQGLRYVEDVHGVVAAPEAELGDTDLLSPFVVRSFAGELPAGLPRDLTRALQGKRIDFAVKVEFLSEVFYDNAPLDRTTFEAQAAPMTIGTAQLQALEVFAPRLGGGTLLRRGRAGVFVSRPPSLPLPETLVIALLDAQG